VNNTFLPCGILRAGDVAQFKRIDDPAIDENEKTIYQGIIVEKQKPCSNGEVTYLVFCDDNTLRFFGDYEAIREISLVGSHETLIK
tara:strand:- start:869 stop:1126 length:258 start_codon:yes stop_codon:yes gene_type:complete